MQVSMGHYHCREVGWLSVHRERQLEVYGRWGRPKVSILHHLNWPHDAVD